MGYRPQKLKLDAKLRPLDQFGFSSQFYFLALLGVGANIFAIIGLMIVLETATNPYLDVVALALLCGNQVLIMAIEALCGYLRRKLKLWEAAADDVGLMLAMRPMRNTADAAKSAVDDADDKAGDE